LLPEPELAGGGSHQSRALLELKTCSDYASGPAKRFISFTRGERKNCPAFFAIIRPDRTESVDFLALEPVKLRSSYYFSPLPSQNLFCRVCADRDDQIERWKRSCANAALTPR
jgi:hypothetical protein